ncbi:MAG: FKBP-type peptidyl-prolyl cis-trans isomerase [Bacteroidaceae bacterium]|nr:FKBP-type peptidyl-prolyl cis-trans isomerase [Bacteroidaceae bacterium]MBQ8735248.1 FKBP-type peptidyl-prolyl cis-trans isomerase [Bacteroidaceae bacterium]
MKKNIKLLLMLPLLLMGIVACDETEEAGEYDNWEVRNVAFIDSIAEVARANASGDWKVFLSYDVNGEMEWDNQYYVYCQVLRQSDGAESPAFTDTVLVNYRGRLIPSKTYPNGAIFDESYLGQLDPEVNVPQKLNLSGCVRGWITAMLHMTKGETLATGDVWRVYIPSTLGYANRTDVSSIPEGSTLIFDLNLVDFFPVGTPVPDDY